MVIKRFLIYLCLVATIFSYIQAFPTSLEDEIAVDRHRRATYGPDGLSIPDDDEPEADGKSFGEFDNTTAGINETNQDDAITDSSLFKFGIENSAYYKELQNEPVPQTLDEIFDEIEDITGIPGDVAEAASIFEDKH